MRLRARELDLNDPTRNELAVDTIKRLTEENRAKLGELGTCYCRIKELKEALDDANAQADVATQRYKDLLASNQSLHRANAELTRELTMLKAERDGLASMLESVQNECIEMRRERDWIDKDREAWMQRFDNLLKTQVAIAALAPVPPVVVKPGTVIPDTVFTNKVTATELAEADNAEIEARRAMGRPDCRYPHCACSSECQGDF